MVMYISQSSYKTTVNVPIPGSLGYLIPDADYRMEITCKVLGIKISRMHVIQPVFQQVQTTNVKL